MYKAEDAGRWQQGGRVARRVVEARSGRGVEAEATGGAGAEQERRGGRKVGRAARPVLEEADGHGVRRSEGGE